MKFEVFIHHVIKYNKDLRRQISTFLNQPLLGNQSKELIRELNQEDLTSSAINLGISSPNDIFEELYGKLRAGLLGESNSTKKTGKKLPKADPGILLNDGFFNLLEEWFSWKNDQDIMLAKVFNLQSTSAFLRKGNLLEADATLPAGRLLGRFLEKHTQLKSFTKHPLFKGDLWSYLNYIMDAEVKKILAKELKCQPSEIFTSLTDRLEPKTTGGNSPNN